MNSLPPEHAPVTALPPDETQRAASPLPTSAPTISVRLRRLLRGDLVGEPSYIVSRWLFMRGLGVVYLIAFASLAAQITGLVGERGILPAARYMARLSQTITGIDRFITLPTLTWFDASDAFLNALCIGGVLVALLLILNIAPRLMAVAAWVGYSSLVVAGQNFLTFQWDTLLLETGLLAIFYAGDNLLPRLRGAGEPSRIVVYLLRSLLFRLMLGAGLVKLYSGDPSWTNLTALDYHYWTQPIPNPVAWYMHQLPAWFDALSLVIMFFIELVVPFFIFTARRLRFAAGLLIAFLMLMLMATGNYTFFNLLTCVLCIPLFDDAALARLLPRRLTAPLRDGARPVRRTRAGYVLVSVLALGIGLVTAVRFGSQVTQRSLIDDLPQPLASLVGTAFRWRIANGYGLFAVMTKARPEIIVEGSNDRQTWLPYTFRYKPGDLTRIPPQIAPHQPRLDWQMWFAAFNQYENVPWFEGFALRLLRGEPSVLALLEHNPFPDTPPRFLRARVVDYTFTDWTTHARTGAWWTTGRDRIWLDTVSLQPF